MDDIFFVRFEFLYFFEVIFIKENRAARVRPESFGVEIRSQNGKNKKLLG